MNVWAGTSIEFCEQGRFRIMEENEVIVVDGKALNRTAIKKAFRADRKPTKEEAIIEELVVWDEKQK